MRPKQTTILITILTILTFSGSTVNFAISPNSGNDLAVVSETTRVDKNFNPPYSEVSYTITSKESEKVISLLYISNQSQVIPLKNKARYILAEASSVKNTTPFRAGTSTPNSVNRYKEWLKSDRTVKYGSPRHYALKELKKYGWDIKPQWGCLDRLWWHESNWKHTAGSPDAAYGIPQSAPGSKMSSAGSDWKTNPKTQINWGLNYIKERYGSPCAAFKFWKEEAESGSRGHGWY